MSSGTAAILVVSALVAAVQDPAAEPVIDRLTLHYDLSVSGIGMAEAEVAVQIGSDGYAIDAHVETYGAASLLEDLTVNASTAGLTPGGAVVPERFETRNLYNGDPRHAEVRWSGEWATVAALAPTLEEEERTSIPDEARLSAFDPLSAMLSFATGAPSQGQCAGTAKVFDGRRSYVLTLDPGEDAGRLESLEIGGTAVTALKCRISSLRTGGKSPDGWLSDTSDSEAAEIWFWRDPAGRAVPVRLEADAPVGYAVAQLSRLP